MNDSRCSSYITEKWTITERYEQWYANEVDFPR